MFEEEGTGSQPQGTEAVSDADRHSSFLGTGFQAEIVSEKEPAPTEAEQTEDAIAQATEGTDEQQETGADAEKPPQEWWLNDYDPELLAKAQKRYPAAFKRLQDGTASDDDRALLRDKLNTDLEIQRRIAEDDEEPTLEDESVQATTDQPASTPEEERKQYYAAIENIITDAVSPQAVEELGRNLLQGFGVDIASDDPEVQALVKNASKVGKTLTVGAVDLMATVLPRILPNLVEQAFPQFSKMYERSIYGLVWDKVRGSEVEGKRPYEALPAYGTTEFRSAMREAARQVEGFGQMVFRDAKSGRILPMEQQAEKKYAMLAKIAAGKRVNPAEVRDAVETGKRLAANADKTRVAGKALGAGKGKPDSAPVKGDINSEIMGAYNARHGNSWGK